MGITALHVRKEGNSLETPAKRRYRMMLIARELVRRRQVDLE